MLFQIDSRRDQEWHPEVCGLCRQISIIEKEAGGVQWGKILVANNSGLYKQTVAHSCFETSNLFLQCKSIKLSIMKLVQHLGGFAVSKGGDEIG